VLDKRIFVTAYINGDNNNSSLITMDGDMKIIKKHNDDLYIKYISINTIEVSCVILYLTSIINTWIQV